MKRVLIVDDDQYKADRAKEAVKQVFYERGIDTEFTIVNCLQGYKQFNRELDVFDLLVLDMNFPVYANDRPKLGLGNLVLTEIDRRKYKIPVIVFSSELELLNKEIKNIIGGVKFDSSVWDKPKFEKVINEYF